MKLHNLLALVTLGLCLAAGTAQADDYPVFQPAPGQPVVDNGAPRAPLFARTWEVTKEFAQNHGVLCAAHHNGDVGCSNWVSEMRYIFGSCRVWWGESCQQCQRTGEPATARPGCNGPGCR
jgi:hypothetical protein